MRVFMLGAISLLALGSAAPAGAQVESKCFSGQLKAGGAYAEAQAKCESKAAAKGEAVDPVCLAKAAEKAAKALAKADAKDDCIVTGQGEDLDEAVEDFVAELVDIMNPPPVICCSSGSACYYTADLAECVAAPLLGTPGAEGSVCTGNGTCGPPPALAGSCCQDFVTVGVALDCATGPFSPADCTNAGGTPSTAVCTPSGTCE